ncbi:hypothetical protein J056_001268 [Wallemia ichthyophaga EXF-994]|uniref:Uncharacterized protein n=1 Tax=Wallemia ichthyophaga (strain EXF-994 / CBS 113033) TaxID=1299270 RepID=R9ACW1_WALI9|nr:uncharacterized protein J056_001268 [Wallemia ichthyophaga EXF-994]EOR00039.1 hypothetical protein J056_001268 [Wallemia ichthyophaga EXF-994]
MGSGAIISRLNTVYQQVGLPTGGTYPWWYAVGDKARLAGREFQADILGHGMSYTGTQSYTRAIEGTFDEKRQAKETICSANLYSIGNEETEAARIRIDAASTSDRPADLIKTPELEDQFVEYKDEEEDEFYAAAKGLTDDVAINRMAIVFQL